MVLHGPTKFHDPFTWFSEFRTQVTMSKVRVVHFTQKIKPTTGSNQYWKLPLKNTTTRVTFWGRFILKWVESQTRANAHSRQVSCWLTLPTCTFIWCLNTGMEWNAASTLWPPSQVSGYTMQTSHYSLTHYQIPQRANIRDDTRGYC